MPLKLLSKKSWHVGNAANVARVRRDEALAKAREEEEDRRLKLAASERDMTELRRGMMGNMVDADGVSMLDKFDSEIRGDGKKKRKRGKGGEEEEEWDRARKGTVDVGLTGSDGHFNLFAELESKDRREGANTVKSYAKKVQEITAPQGDALKQDNVDARPWYVSPGLKGETHKGKSEEIVARKEKAEEMVVARDDPMAEVKKSLGIMKNLEEERRRERKEREGLLDGGDGEGRRRKGGDRDRDRRSRRRDVDDEERRRRRRRDGERDRSRSPRSDEKRKERARERSKSRDRDARKDRHHEDEGRERSHRDRHHEDKDRERSHRDRHHRHHRTRDDGEPRGDRDEKPKGDRGDKDNKDDKDRHHSRRHHRHRDEKSPEDRHRSSRRHDRKEATPTEERKAEETGDFRHPSRRYRDTN